MTDVLEHAEFCLPRPGHDEPRTERYMLTAESEDGSLMPRRTLVHRCVECGQCAYARA